ncbi:MAG: amino acid deaminase [Ectothiorhodospiraceae bacterium]|nr:amino acid deaminase [Ectothiorhodospiraceae bacterium]
MAMDTGAIGKMVIDGATKGVPGGVAPFALDDVAGHGWNLLREDLPLPVAVIRESAMDHNERWMHRFLELSGAKFAPHGKTTMSPQLFERQLASGAWAITLATPHQIQVARRYGVPRIVLANQLLGAPAIRFVLDELHRDPGFEFYCIVDSVEGVERLGEAVAAHPLTRPLTVWVEGGAMGGRTGARTIESALAVARRVRDFAPHLALTGVEGFEGLLEADSAAAQDRVVADFLGYLCEIAAACDAEGLFGDVSPVILSAGGSAFYDMVVERFRAALPGRETMVLTRSGCYLTHDSKMYTDFFARLRARTRLADNAGPGLRPALEVWAYVQSRPEPGKAVLTFGKRDVSYDAHLPVLEQWYRPGTHQAPIPCPPGGVVTGLNDQHAHVRLPADSPLAVGDMVSVGISHPCTTFDKWQVIWLVDDDYRVTGAVRTFF